MLIPGQFPLIPGQFPLIPATFDLTKPEKDSPDEAPPKAVTALVVLFMFFMVSLIASLFFLPY